MAQTTRTLSQTATGEVEVTDAPQDSIELSVNAKGEPSWSVKVYAATDAELAERLAKSRKIAEEHAASIRAGKGASQ